MITRKPKSFSLVYENGVQAEHCDPITGKRWYKLRFAVLKSSMARLAALGGESLTLINNCNDDSLTVTPEGRWL